MADPEIFFLSETTKAKLRAKNESGRVVPDEVIAEFCELAASEECPRKAGSILAHRFMLQSAVIAIIGADEVGRAPSKELFLEAASDGFDAAVKIVAEAKAAQASADGDG